MSIFVCVTFICLAACSPQKSSSSEESLTPLLTMQDILKAPDFKERVSYAALNKDIEALKLLQKDLLNLAKQARLPPADIAKLSGEQGLVFLEFQGKLLNYDKEFMQRLTSFQDLSVLFERYPKLVSLHQYSKDIEAQRDLAITALIEDLKAEGVTGDLKSIAKSQWLNALHSQRNNH